MTTITRCSWVLALVLAVFGAASAGAQPTAVGTVAPPARTDVALRGQVLATVPANGHAACHAECKRLGGCSGYNHSSGKALLPASPLGGLGGPAPNCTLLTGTLTDAPARGVVSCRMPCEVNAATASPAGSTRQPMPMEVTPRPGGAILRPIDTTAPPASTPGSVAVPVTVPPVVSTYTPPPPPPPPAPARSAITGYQVVEGAEITIAPLSHAVASAACPGNKVALSAGWQFMAGGDASFGLEVRGALPEGNQVRVLMRNANVFVPAQARAVAVCVNPIAGLRSVDADTSVIGGTSGIITDKRIACTSAERVVGGGVMGTLNTMVGTSAPQGGNTDGVWHLRLMSSSPLPGSGSTPSRVLCAPETQVDGWERVQGAPVQLGARTQATLNQACPGDKVMLAAGLVQAGNNLLDLVSNHLAPAGSSLTWSAQVHNRNTVGGGGPVDVSTAAVCARRG